MASARPAVESPGNADALLASCSSLASADMINGTEPASTAVHDSEQIACTPAFGREEEFSDGSGEEDAEDDDDVYAEKCQGGDSVPQSFDSEGTGAYISPNFGTDALKTSNRLRNVRQRVRIRGYRPLDELRSFAKVLITSLNREFVTPRLDYSVPPPANLLEGLGDAHIMGSTLYNQMKVWLSGSNDECARDMAAYFKVKGEFGVPNRANRYHVEFTLKKFLLPKVVAMFCQRRLLTEIMLQNGMPGDFYTEHPNETPALDAAQKEIFLAAVNSSLAEVDKVWPMSPSTDEVDDDWHRKQTTDGIPKSATACSPPPVNNAFQVYGKIIRVSQHDDGSVAALGPPVLESGKEALKPLWIRPWDSVFDRKKNGFGTFFAKKVLELCHCDETTMSRVLSISMRHIAVKKSEMVFKKSINATLAAGNAIAGLAVPVIKRNRDAASTCEDTSHNLSPVKAPAHMYAPAGFLHCVPSIQIPIKLNKALSLSAHQSGAPMTDATTTADQELLVKTTLSSVWSQISSLECGQIEQDMSLLEPMVIQVFRNPIACMCGALGLPYNSPYSKELVLLDLAVMKAASQPQMHSFYAQIVAQRNAYAMQALPLLQQYQANCYAAAAAAAAAPNVNTGSVSSANTVSSCTETDTTPPETLPCAPDVAGALPQVQSRAVSSESSYVPEAVADASEDSSAHQGRPKVMDMS